MLASRISVDLCRFTEWRRPKVHKQQEQRGPLRGLHLPRWSPWTPLIPTTSQLGICTCRGQGLAKATTGHWGMKLGVSLSAPSASASALGVNRHFPAFLGSSWIISPSWSLAHPIPDPAVILGPGSYSRNSLPVSSISLPYSAQLQDMGLAPERQNGRDAKRYSRLCTQRKWKSAEQKPAPLAIHHD